MRSPAPSQGLQVTGGILNFAVYQDIAMRLETRRDGNLNLHGFPISLMDNQNLYLSNSYKLVLKKLFYRSAAF